MFSNAPSVSRGFRGRKRTRVSTLAAWIWKSFRRVISTLRNCNWFPIVVPWLCGTWEAEVMGWAPPKAKGGSSPFHRLEPPVEQPLECVITLMSCGACQGMWSGRLLLWSGHNWPCHRNSKLADRLSANHRLGKMTHWGMWPATLAPQFFNVYDTVVLANKHSNQK